VVMGIRAAWIWDADRPSPLVKALRAELQNLVETEDSAPVAAVIRVGPCGSLLCSAADLRSRTPSVLVRNRL
jgi:hypothetical protein